MSVIPFQSYASMYCLISVANNYTVITGSVDITIPGTYAITYSATDASGNSASLTRQVIVLDADIEAVVSVFFSLYFSPFIMQFQTLIKH